MIVACSMRYSRSSKDWRSSLGLVLLKVGAAQSLQAGMGVGEFDMLMAKVVVCNERSRESVFWFIVGVKAGELGGMCSPKLFSLLSDGTGRSLGEYKGDDSARRLLCCARSEGILMNKASSCRSYGFWKFAISSSWRVSCLVA